MRHSFRIVSNAEIPAGFVEEEGSIPHVEGIPECIVIDACCKKWRRLSRVEKRGEGRWRVRSYTDPDITYLVKHWLGENRYSCDCGDNLYRGGVCKHIRDVLATIKS